MKQLPKLASTILLISIASFFFGIAVMSIAFVLVSLCTVVLFINTLRSNNVVKGEFSNLLLILLVLYVYILGREAFFGFENWLDIAIKYLPFLIFPLFLTLLKPKPEFKKNVATVYIFGALLSAFINCCYAVYRGVILPEKTNLWYFTYNFLAEPFSLQPIYLALFYVFALILLVDRLKRGWYYWLVFGFLLVNLFLLSARNAMITALLLIPAYLLINKRLSKKTLVGFVIVVVGTFALAIQTPVVKNRISKVARKGNFFSGTSLRYNIWSSAVDAAEKNLVFGSGKHQGRVLLVEEFKKRKLRTPIKYDYHAHNQFLAFLVEYGVIGILLFLALLFQLGYTFLKNGEILGFFWLLMVFFACITETILTRQWGIIYFALFASYFWKLATPRNSTINIQLDK